MVELAASGAETFTVDVVETRASNLLVAVIVALPAPTAVTFPRPSTVATAPSELLKLHATPALLGVGVTVREYTFPVITELDAGVSARPVGARDTSAASIS